MLHIKKSALLVVLGLGCLYAAAGWAQTTEEERMCRWIIIISGWRKKRMPGTIVTASPSNKMSPASPVPV